MYPRFVLVYRPRVLEIDLFVPQSEQSYYSKGNKNAASVLSISAGLPLTVLGVVTEEAIKL